MLVGIANMRKWKKFCQQKTIRYDGISLNRLHTTQPSRADQIGCCNLVSWISRFPECTSRGTMIGMSKNKKKIGVALTAYSLTLMQKSWKRRIWIKKGQLKEKSHLISLKELDSSDFRNYFRMDHDCFQQLLNLIHTSFHINKPR